MTRKQAILAVLLVIFIVIWHWMYWSEVKWRLDHPSIIIEIIIEKPTPGKWI